MTAESRLIRRLRRETVSVLPSSRNHGRRPLYVAGCRCDPCTDAEADYSWDYKRRARGLRGCPGCLPDALGRFPIGWCGPDCERRVNKN